MSNAFNKSDRKFLKSIGVRSADTALDAERLALAERIATHQAPGQHVAVNPDAARLELIKLSLLHLLDAEPEDDGTFTLLERMGLPVTRENYLRAAFLGNPPEELDGEVQAELPPGLQEPEEEQ
jgi:hypothetical protein